MATAAVAPSQDTPPTTAAATARTIIAHHPHHHHPPPTIDATNTAITPLSLNEDHFSPDKAPRRCADDDTSGVQYISPCRVDCEGDALRWRGPHKGSGGSPDSVDEVAETTWWDTMRQVRWGFGACG